MQICAYACIHTGIPKYVRAPIFAHKHTQTQTALLQYKEGKLSCTCCRRALSLLLDSLLLCAQQCVSKLDHRLRFESEEVILQMQQAVVSFNSMRGCQQSIVYAFPLKNSPPSGIGNGPGFFPFFLGCAELDFRVDRNCSHHTAREGYDTLIQITQQEKDRVRAAGGILHPASIKSLISQVRWSSCVQQTTCPVVSNADSGVAAEFGLGARHAKSACRGRGHHVRARGQMRPYPYGLIKFTVDTLKAQSTVSHPMTHQLNIICSQFFSLFCSFLDGGNPTSSLY